MTDSKNFTEQRRFDRETVTKFQKLLDDSGLKTWIVLAGIGGVAAIVAVVIEGIRGIVDISFYYHPN